MKHKKVTLALVGLLAGVVLLTAFIHRMNREKVFSQFQERQLLQAQNIAGEIEEFFRDHSMILQTILSSCRYEGVKRLRRDIGLYSEMMKARQVKEVSFFDEFGNPLYSTGSRPGLPTGGYDEVSAAAGKTGNQQEIFVFPLALDRVVIAFPVYQERPADKNGPGQSRKIFVGIFSITTDLKKFLLREPEAPGLLSSPAWIMNRDGTLLYHSQRPEMVSRNLSRRDATCNHCHVQNGYIEKILKEKEGKIEYALDEGPRKLGAFSSARFGKSSWTIMVSSDYDRVAGLGKKDLPNLLALLGLVFLAALLGYFQLLRKERLKTKAEEESKRWRERITESQKAEDDLKKSTDRLHLLSKELLNAQERELKRITNELHDELGQDLTVLRLLLGHILKKLPEDQQEIRELSKETIRCADHLVENVRRVFHDLSPHILENFGLTVALQRLIKDFSKLHGIGIQEEITHIDHLVPREAHILVYRILQEILTNIGKHAEAGLVSVVLIINNDHLYLTVEDDGKGFDIDRTILGTADGKGMGLAILDERVRMLNGELDIQSKEGYGTQVNIAIPIPGGMPDGTL